jgi:Cu(I)/Ag(I) efflux system protein CusF
LPSINLHRAVTKHRLVGYDLPLGREVLPTAPLVALAQSTTTDGLVIKIAQAAGKITIKHGPLKQFEMDEGMTMVYRADDPALLKNIRVGDKIKFVADRVNGDRKGPMTRGVFSTHSCECWLGVAERSLPP